MNQIGPCGPAAGFRYWSLTDIVRRMALEKSLVERVPEGREAFASAFLSGLSVDELLFLSDFLGSCILIASGLDIHAWDAICPRAHTFRRGLDSGAHKLLLLGEFGARSGISIRFR